MNNKILKKLCWFNPFAFLFCDPSDLLTYTTPESLKVDSRGIPVALTMPKVLINKIYKAYSKKGMYLNADQWWELQDEYNANGLMFFKDCIDEK